MTPLPPVPHPFEHDDAAYVLGALDPADAAAFEAHLAGCAACRERVRQARSTVALLGPPTESMDAGAMAAPDFPNAMLPDDAALPDTVLPALVRAVRRERHRRHLTAGALVAVAAACLVALVVAVWPTSHSAPPRSTAQAMTPLAGTPVRATVELADRRWGTAIDVHCRYAKNLDANVSYELRVRDRDGDNYPAGSWQLAPGGVTDFVGGTQVPRDQIDKLQVTLPSGQPVLSLTVH